MTVKTGLQRLLERGLHRQETIGLITNHTGLGEDLSRNVDLMLRSGYRVKALFSPEHGIDGDLSDLFRLREPVESEKYHLDGGSFP